MKKDGEPEDLHVLESIYGMLFFGVPHYGMDVEGLSDLIGDKSQRHILEEVNRTVGSRAMGRRHDDFCQAFNFEDSKIIHIFEALKTSTPLYVSRPYLNFAVILTDSSKNEKTQTWERIGPEKLLVDYRSATFRRLEPNLDKIMHVNANHSNIVKFARFDQVSYKNILDELRSLTRDAPRVIALRSTSNATSSTFLPA
jgi:hypothetical protein